MSKTTEAKKKRRSPRIRCLKGQRHRWLLGSASRASDAGTLGGERPRSHLRGECRYCHKVRNFHPYAAKGKRMLGTLSTKKQVA